MALAEHKLQVGAHHAECLVDHITASLLHHDSLSAVHELGLADVAPKYAVVDFAFFLLDSRCLGDFANKRQREFLEVLAAAHHSVEHILQIDDGHGYYDADYQGYEKHLSLLGRGGTLAATRLVDDASVVGGECLRQLILLALLQQGEVQGLLDLLLTLY